MKHTGTSPNGFLGKCGSAIPFTTFFLVMIEEKWAVSADESGGLPWAHTNLENSLTPAEGSITVC